MFLELKGGGAINVRSPQNSDFNASVGHNIVSKFLSGGSTNNETVADANYTSYTGATYYREGNIVIEGMGNPKIINLTPDIGSVSDGGEIIRNSSGVMRLLFRNSLITLPLKLDLRDRNDETGQPMTFVSTVSGSLAEHCQNQIDDRIDNTLTMSNNGGVFSIQNHSLSSYTRNPNLWCSDVDLTCISPWNSNGGVKKAGTLITPRHFINSAHYEVNVNDVIRWVENDGTIHNRIVKGKTRHPNYSPYNPDLTVYTLNTDLPASIKPCKVMPSNWNTYLVNNFDNRPPALGLDQEEKALIIDFHINGSFRIPIDPDRLIFHENKISGDSGNPAFLIVGDELILVTCWTFGGAGSGTPIASYIDDINQMIITSDTQAGVSTGYTLTEADFSSFPQYA